MVQDSIVNKVNNNKRNYECDDEWHDKKIKTN